MLIAKTKNLAAAVLLGLPMLASAATGAIEVYKGRIGKTEKIGR